MTLLRADARALPFPARTFDVIFTSPPWDDLGVLREARREMTRVLRRRGIMLLLLPHLEGAQWASLAVTNFDWTERQTFKAPAPTEKRGPNYYSMSDDFVQSVIHRYIAKSWRLLDPFCGTGTVPRVAKRMGVRAVGLDIDANALPRPR